MDWKIKWQKKKKVVIEVCERLMDYALEPELKRDRCVGMKRVPKFHAQIKREPGFWGCGKSHDEAVGSLIRAHPEYFGMKVKDLGKLPR